MALSEFQCSLSASTPDKRHVLLLQEALAMRVIVSCRIYENRAEGFPPSMIGRRYGIDSRFPDRMSAD